MKQFFHTLGLVALSAAFMLMPLTETSAASPAQDVAREKRARTPVQQKIDSQLLYALYRRRGEAEARGVPSGDLRVKFDEKGRAIISIRARVTRSLLAKIKRLGGEVISSSAEYKDIQAHLPLEKMEELASLKEVSAIMPADEAMTNR